MKPIALYYLSLLDDIRAVARAFGYAIGLHGSLIRDFDLIACPWSETARPAEELVEAIAKLVGGAWNPNCCEAKPHGRKAWLIFISPGLRLGTTPVIDLSVMPLSPAPSEPATSG